MDEVPADPVIDKAVTARVVKKLEIQGLIRRSPDPSDKRALRLSLTPEGEAMIPEINKILGMRKQILLKGLSPQEEEAALVLLDRMISNALSAGGDV